jgi:rubrerythrin
MKQTVENLSKAFVGESQARNRYTIYSKVAKKEGFEQIADLFLLTAENEREHAKWSFRLINELKEKSGESFDDIEIKADVPTDYGTTAENLKAAINGETYETTTMYPEFAQAAEDENLPEIAARLRAIGKAEMHHKERFEKLLREVENGTVFKKEKEVEWVCRKCGYVHKGPEPPEECPSCDHPYNYFERKCEEY